ncbi:hypothetical protein [Alkaliphilus sp. B6464]|nr:hypothetical protein [Alkaliphilus sp. B6464]
MSKDLSNYILNEKQLKDGNQLILRKPIIEDAEKIVGEMELAVQ